MNTSNFPLRSTEDLRIHIQTSKSSNCLNEILRNFPEVKALKIGCLGVHLALLQDLGLICPSLNSLTVLTKNMPDFDLSPLLTGTLTELVIYQRGNPVDRKLSSLIRLPKLKKLGVTYPSSEFLECLELPRLEFITLYGPHSHCAHPNYGPTAIKTFENISRLQLRGFAKRSQSTTLDDTSHTSYNATPVFTKLAVHMSKLQSASFLFGDLDGVGLVKLLDSAERGDGILPLLKIIAISECKGITRADCEKLQTLVSQVIVYVGL
ncbi:hypothetical protein CPB86DRAFT_713281 [Serendipita vermifera]|nr:hypothetical protein CPB86DRAFT_713281 [Serendipita vermifera]